MSIKTVVTGGAGFIGSHIVDRLIDRGDDVHVIDNLSGGYRENVNARAVFHEIDITSLSDLHAVMKGATYVFHLAALPRVQFSIDYPISTHNVNVTGTANVLHAAQEAGVRRVVFSSSSSVYGDQDTLPLGETMTPQPKSPYGLHKYTGELYCQMWHTIYNLETVSLRYFNIYGTRQDPNGAYALVIAKFLQQRAERKPLTITGDGEQTRDFTHVSDAVDANIYASESMSVGAGEVINIGAGNNVSINKIAELIGGEAVYVDARYEPRDTLADNSNAKELLGWEPTVSIEKGIQELKKERDS